jgi:hypothetical protein
MICEECNRREATVFLTQIINGETIKLGLCAVCAGPLLDQTPTEDELEPETIQTGAAFSLSPDQSRPTSIAIPDPVPVRALASSLQAKPFEIIRDLMHLNIFASMNTEIPFPIAADLCSRYGITAIKVA